MSKPIMRKLLLSAMASQPRGMGPGPATGTLRSLLRWAACEGKQISKVRGTRYDRGLEQYVGMASWGKRRLQCSNVFQ